MFNRYEMNSRNAKEKRKIISASNYQPEILSPFPVELLSPHPPTLPSRARKGLAWGNFTWGEIEKKKVKDVNHSSKKRNLDAFISK